MQKINYKKQLFYSNQISIYAYASLHQQKFESEVSSGINSANIFD